MRVRLVAEARREFLAEVRYYEETRVGLGGQFRKAVEKATSLASAFPQAGSPCAADTRRVVVRGFPFSVVYRLEGVELVVFAVAHSRRDPAYWVHRADG